MNVPVFFVVGKVAKEYSSPARGSPCEDVGARKRIGTTLTGDRPAVPLRAPTIYNSHMVKFDPQKHHRRSIRLLGYDYASASAYYVTIVAWQRECLFGEVVNKEMVLNRYGEIVQRWWDEIPFHFANVETGAFIVMPNHVHGIIVILNGRGAVPAPEEHGANESFNNNDISSEIQGRETPPLHQTTSFLQTPTLGQIVAYFKYKSTKEMNLLDNTDTVTKFWQRNYYEHIIRNATDLQNKTDYIESNPLLWDEDDENPINGSG